MIDQLARRQRRERLAGVALATLGVAVLVLSLFALRSPNGHGTVAGRATTTVAVPSKSVPKSSPAKTLASRASSPRPAASKLPLVVLNNTDVAGLAERARVRFEAGGWTVTGTGSLPNDILSTCAYFDPGVPGAQAGARALQAQFPAIKRVVPKFAQLPPGPIVVVLTTDYS